MRRFTVYLIRDGGMQMEFLSEQDVCALLTEDATLRIIRPATNQRAVLAHGIAVAWIDLSSVGV